MSARPVKSLKPSGGDHGYKHREHRSNKGRKKVDRGGKERLQLWWELKGKRKVNKKMKRDLRKIIKDNGSN